MDYNLLIHEVFWSYNPVANLLPTFWDIQVASFLLRIKGRKVG